MRPKPKGLLVGDDPGKRESRPNPKRHLVLSKCLLKSTSPFSIFSPLDTS